MNILLVNFWHTISIGKIPAAIPLLAGKAAQNAGTGGKKQGVSLSGDRP
jgi:hypothetical protein